MHHSLTPISEEDREAVMDIFNHYVANSFAAYPDQALPYQVFDLFLQMAKGFPAATIRDRDGRIVGFGLLRSHNPIPVFSRTAEITCFIHPDYTGKGLGKMLLDHLEKGATEKGITNILANISSLNPESIHFHLKNGFVECGRFKQVGKKKGQEFDTVWMQKRI
jgi:L-amino acid N-acyltransferase YncA